MFDFGTIFLVISVILAMIDVFILVIGPKILSEEDSGGAFLATVGAFLFMAVLIFTNDISYQYVVQTTKSTAPLLLKLSALWAGQAGSLLFWAFLAFTLYFGFRYLIRGYEDDIIVYRASAIMGVSSILIVINAIISSPFAPYQGPDISDGYGLNPLLSTILNVIHPPIVFIAYALLMVPFAIKLAGFTVRSEERRDEPIPIVERYASFTTSFAWLMLSLGIVIGAYWAYSTLGWGGYWGWDPVETSSLIPWLLLTGFYHAKAIFKDNDVLRDSFLVFSYITVLFATWVTRSGVLTSVHGFTITVVSWTMFLTLLGNFIFSILLITHAGLKDMSDDEEESGWPSIFSLQDLRKFSIFIALIGILVISFTSFAGVAMPAAINIGTAIFDPTNLENNMVGINIEFFWLGFYIASFFLFVSAFYCMRNTAISARTKSVIALILIVIGAIIGLFSYAYPDSLLPTNSLIANMLVPLAIGAIVYLGVTFVRYMAGRESGAFTMRQMGRLMLHLGLVMLLLGVFMSSNIEYQSRQDFIRNIPQEIAPGLELRVSGIQLSEDGLTLYVAIQLFQDNMSIGVGVASLTLFPGYENPVSNVYIHSTAGQDIFIAIAAYSGSTGNMVTLQTKVLPLISFVWLGIFFMIMAILPSFVMEASGLFKAVKRKHAHLYGEEEEEAIETDMLHHLEMLLKSEVPAELIRSLSMTPLLLTQGRYSEAELELRTVTELYPGYMRAWYLFGAVLNIQRKYAEAEAAFRRTVELDSEFGEAWYILGNTLRNLGKDEDADEAFQQAKVLGYNPRSEE